MAEYRRIKDEEELYERDKQIYKLRRNAKILYEIAFLFYVTAERWKKMSENLQQYRLPSAYKLRSAAFKLEAESMRTLRKADQYRNELFKLLSFKYTQD